MSGEGPDLRRKGWRVAGMFAFMVGAGIVLESAALWTGAGVTAVGLALYAASFVAKTPPGVLAGEVREES